MNEEIIKRNEEIVNGNCNEVYDYESQVRHDLALALNEYKDGGESDRDKMREWAFNDDTVTGNGSGSYFFSTWKTENAMCHNWGLLGVVLESYCRDAGSINPGIIEHYDVTIRCYFLDQVFDEVFDEVFGADNKQ